MSQLQRDGVRVYLGAQVLAVGLAEVLTGMTSALSPSGKTP